MSVDLYGTTADHYAQTYNIPTHIFRGLVQRESGWNPAAEGRHGDKGLTQLTPRIYNYYKVDPWKPEENLRGGAQFLSDNFKRYGNWRDALAHYNAGFNIKAGYNYADKVLAIAEKLKNGESVTSNVINKAQDKNHVWDFIKQTVGGGAVRDAIVNKADEVASDAIQTFWEKLGVKTVIIVLIGLLLLLAITRLIK